jgi:hypothetical protein
VNADELSAIRITAERYQQALWAVAQWFLSGAEQNLEPIPSKIQFILANALGAQWKSEAKKQND